MITPDKIINYNRTASEIEELIIFTVAVAGKNARTTAHAVDRFLKNTISPFEYIRKLERSGTLLDEIKLSRLGNYTKLYHVYKTLAFTYPSGLDLKSLSREDLCKIKGIGMKTASCFLGWVLPDVKYAMLDVHVLRFLAKTFPDKKIPKTTPADYKKYLELENLFLTVCGDKNPAEVDLEIWRNGSNSRYKKDSIS